MSNNRACFDARIIRNSSKSAFILSEGDAGTSK
jgi:hypothetical protein